MFFSLFAGYYCSSSSERSASKSTVRSIYFPLQNNRKLLLIAAAVLACLILYGVFLPSLYAKNRDLRVLVSRQMADAAWMQSAAEKLRKHKNPQTGARNKAGVSMLTAINQSATSSFGTTIKRIEESKQGSVQIWFEHAVFDEIVLWLDKLESANGIQASLVVINKTAYPGRVDARIQLESG